MSPDEDEEQHLLLLEDYPLDATSSVLKSLSPAERSFGMEVRSPQILKRSRALFASAAITAKRGLLPALAPSFLRSAYDPKEKRRLHATS